MASFPWFDTVEGERIEQGDLLFDFPVIVPIVESRNSDASASADEVLVDEKLFDVIVLTQTCDIEANKIKSLLLCPWRDLWGFVDAAQGTGENWGSDIREDLRRGNLPGYHLINEVVQDGLEIGLGVVDFHEVYTAPTSHVRGFALRAGKRLRLRPPYREHLAQAFARFFMRVGLPVDIPKEKVRKRPIG